jgi:hypothetical protein
MNRGLEIDYPMVQVSNEAFAILKNILETHGTTLGKAQFDILKHLVILYFKIMTGRSLGVESRVVAPLPTGYGKTSSIVATIVALHRAQEDPAHPAHKEAWQASLGVSAWRIESLAELKRELVNQCGPGILPKLGLIHSYQFSQEKLELAKRTGQPLPAGFVSEPAILAEPQSKPFMLLSHNKIKNATDETQLQEFMQYQGKDRSLLVWDESLLPSEALSLDVNSLDTGAYHVSKDKTLDDDLKDWLRTAVDLMEAVDTTDGEVVTLPILPEEDKARHEQALRASGHQEIISPCKTALSMAGHSVRVHPSNKGMAARYEVQVPNRLKNLVVLDASYVVRELVRSDQRMKPIYRLPGLFRTNLTEHFWNHKASEDKSPKSYKNLTVKLMDAPWGRQAIETELVNVKEYTQRKFLSDIIDVVKSIPEDEGVLIFTYKDKGRISPRAALIEALEDAGIDTSATITEPTRGLKRPRINLSTWGQETATNSFAYCRHVILAGVMQLPGHALMGRLLAAKDDLSAEYTKETAATLDITESVHLVYQAASRGSCRMTEEDGSASAMALYLTSPKDKTMLRKYLDRVFPEATYETWEGKFSKTRDEGKTKQAKTKILDCLDSLEELGYGGERVSSQSLRKTFPELQEIPKSTYRNAVSDLKFCPERNWTVEGRSFVQVFS